MPLTMNREVFITCAVTGGGGTQDRSPLTYLVEPLSTYFTRAFRES